MAINNLTRYFLEEHPRESARILASFSVETVVAFIETLPLADSVSLIRYLHTDMAINCLITLAPEQSARVLENLEVDTGARLLSRMKLSTRNRILGLIKSSHGYRLRQLLRHPVGTIGQFMSPAIFTATEEMTVAEVIKAAREASSELLSDIFILDEKGELAGVIDLRGLLLAEPAEELQQIMNIPDTVLNVRSNLEYVKNNPRWQFKEVLPVTDHNNHFGGVLKRSIMHEVLSSDYLKAQDDTPVMETVFEVADLFWDVCASMITSKNETGKDEQRHE